MNLSKKNKNQDLRKEKEPHHNQVNKKKVNLRKHQKNQKKSKR